MTVREIIEYHEGRKWFVFVDGKLVNKGDFLDEVPNNYNINTEEGYIYFVTE